MSRSAPRLRVRTWEITNILYGGLMTRRTLSKLLAQALWAAALGVAVPARAQVIPLESERSIFAFVSIGNANGHGQGLSTDPDQFGPFVVSVSPHTAEYGSCGEGEPDTCVVSVCDAYAGQNSTILDGGIQFSGEASGAWSGETEGQYKFRSICKIRFHLDIPVDYTILLGADPGDLVPGEVYASLEGPTPDLTIHYTQFGTLQATGQLGPGDYVLQGRTSTDARSDPYTSGGFYACDFWVNPIDTLKNTAGFPLDQRVACGGTASFTIGDPGPPGTLAYQWRRGLTPLTNNGNISGATSPTLTISNACTADEGYYSVAATVIGSNPVLTIPSRFAYLSTVSTTTGVAADGVTAALSSFAPAAPNPFQSETALHYTVPPSTRVVAAVYNAAGARVRELANVILSGSGSIGWDGRTQAGERAPAGVYFVRLQAGAVRDSKKVVLLK
jgi:flagellar hook capping protein FlgD